MSWLSRLKSPRLRLYLAGVRTLEEKQVLYGRKWLYLGVCYWCYWEVKRTFLQEEWERKSWVPPWVLTSRREHYINNEYVRKREGKTTVFTFSNWDQTSGMVYHVDNKGNHVYEKLVLPKYYHGVLENTEDVKYLSRLAMYNMNKNKRYDLDNYLNHRTVTLGD